MPLIIPARQRALDAFSRSVPWILWVSIMHVCYIFLRDILIIVVDDAKGSLPEYIKAITTNTALSDEVLPMLVLGGIFLVMPIISGAFIALVHLLMVRSPKWVQITAGAFTVLVAGAQLPAHLGGSGPHGATRRIRGRDDLPRAHSASAGALQRGQISQALARATTSTPQPSKAESGTPPKTGSKRRKSSNTGPSKSRPGAPSSSP